MIAHRVTSLLIAAAVAISVLFQTPPVAHATVPLITPIAQISAADVGKVFTVQGAVVGTSNFSIGFKLDLNDGSGQLVLLIWEDVYDHIWNNYRLNTGAVVSATGKVDVYRGDLELIPDRGRDVQVVEPAKRDWRKYQLGALTGNDHNAVVWVEGTVADIQSFSQGTVLLIADSSGAQSVKLYDVVARRIPRQEMLWIGQRVSVLGRVRAKQRVGIEIVVALPHDVYVLGPAKNETPHTGKWSAL